MMLAQAVTMAQALEAVMLVCFGVSWPVDILKCLRTRRTEGKSLAFMSIILVGYVCGVSAKIAKSARSGEPLEAVTALYALNFVLVAVDIALYLRFSRLGRAPQVQEEPGEAT